MFIPEAKPINSSMIDGKGKQSLTLSEVAQGLTRTEFWNMDMFYISASLVTPYSIELSEKEKGQKNLDSNEQIERNIKKEKSKFTDLKTCFVVGFMVPGSAEAAQFKNWVFKVKMSDNQIHELKYLPTEQYPDIGKPSPVQALSWMNGGYVCSQKPLLLVNNFELHSIPQLIYGELGGPRVLKWEVDGARKESIKD